MRIDGVRLRGTTSGDPVEQPTTTTTTAPLDGFTTTPPPRDAPLVAPPDLKLKPTTTDVTGKVRLGLKDRAPTLDLEKTLGPDRTKQLVDAVHRDGVAGFVFTGRQRLEQDLRELDREHPLVVSHRAPTKRPSDDPSLLEKGAWFLGASVLTGLKDYALYNPFRPKDPSQKVSPWYRVEQAAWQTFTGLTLAKNVGLGTALAYGTAQWTGAIDLYGYYGAAELFGKERPDGDPRWEHKGVFQEVVNGRPDWFGWTPAGIVNNVVNGEGSLSGRTLLWQANAGLVVGTGLMLPQGGLLGTPMKKREWFDRLTPFIPTF